MIKIIHEYLEEEPAALECMTAYNQLNHINDFLAGNTNDWPEFFTRTAMNRCSNDEIKEFTKTVCELSRYYLGSPQFDSPIESILYWWLSLHGHVPISQWRVPTNDGIKRIDLAYPDIKLAIECNGEQYHAGLHNLKKDRARRIELQAKGWEVIPVWGKDIYSRTLEVVDFIDDVIEERKLRCETIN